MTLGKASVSQPVAGGQKTLSCHAMRVDPFQEMLTQASVTLPHPSKKVVASLTTPDHAWSVALDGNGGDLLAKVGISVGRVPVYKHVRLEIGLSSAALLPESVMLPVSWVAVGGPPIFPKMEGTLHVEPEGPGLTRLTLNARYDPPMGRVGELIDRAMMHRVAALTMTDFVERLARAVADELEKAERA
jgi:hypothetical protein